MRVRRVLLGLVGTLVLSVGASAQTVTTPAPGTVAPSIVLVCGPAPSGSPASTYCPNDANGNPQVPTVQQGYILSSTDYASLEAAIAPFDYPRTPFLWCVTTHQRNGVRGPSPRRGSPSSRRGGQRPLAFLALLPYRPTVHSICPCGSSVATNTWFLLSNPNGAKLISR